MYMTYVACYYNYLYIFSVYICYETPQRYYRMHMRTQRYQQGCSRRIDQGQDQGQDQGSM